MIFDSTYFGPEGLTKDDCQYAGSRYSEIRRELFANAYYLNDVVAEEPLPVFGVTLGRVLHGLIPCAKRWLFRQAAGRAVDSPADMRWGPYRRGYRRLLHPNGICLFGRWKIDDNASKTYSGHFQPGSEALIIARYSTCCTETRRGNTRSLALVGKLFPTKDENHAHPLRTANFITQENIGGAYSMSLQDAVLKNAPDTSPLRRGFDLPILLVTALVFRLTDREIDNRQLYEIAELGKPPDQPTSTPEFMQLKLTEGQPVIYGDDLDFRDEILKHIYASGEPGTVRPLSFDIEVTDESRKRGLLSPKRDFLNKWNRIGRIEFHEAVASYNGDFVLHFRHPPWRANRNDPTTVTQYKHRKPC